MSKDAQSNFIKNSQKLEMAQIPIYTQWNALKQSKITKYCYTQHA